MKLGAKGEALIKSYEKLRLTAYQDLGGVWTIGWGHTGPGVGEGTTCTVEQAQVWFWNDTSHAVNATNSHVTTALNQNQFDALVSFTYNVGVGAEERSTLLRLVNTNDMVDAAAEFARWNKVNGKVSEGLTARRAAERDLFVSAV